MDREREKTRRSDPELDVNQWIRGPGVSTRKLRMTRVADRARRRGAWSGEERIRVSEPA